jgi:serine protease Do
MMRRFLLCMFSFALAVSLASLAQPAGYYDLTEDGGSWGSSSDEGGSGSSYLGVDIADVSAERLGELKLKEEHGAEITMVDQDAPAGKAGLHEHDVIVSVNGTAVESAAQLRRIIKETPPGRVVSLGISRDGQAMTIKVQLADRHKSMSWEPQVHVNIPPIPSVPAMPDFDLPVSVVIVHQSARSGLMVENISPQLGDFFGVKDGKGVLVRSVEKGSRGEKAGFRAGDVVVKVNNQPVHDTSDFTHALRSSSSGTAAVTVMRDKREQNLTLTLPEKKDTGSVQEEDTFDIRNFTAQTEQAMSRANEMAQLAPKIEERAKEQAERCQELQQRQQELEERQEEMREQAEARQENRQQELENQREAMQDRAEEMQDREQELRERQQERQEELHLQLSKKLADI